MMAANEILELFCERLVTRLSIIAKQRYVRFINRNLANTI